MAQAYGKGIQKSYYSLWSSCYILCQFFWADQMPYQQNVAWFLSTNVIQNPKKAQRGKKNLKWTLFNNTHVFLGIETTFWVPFMRLCWQWALLSPKLSIETKPMFGFCIIFLSKLEIIFYTKWKWYEHLSPILYCYLFFHHFIIGFWILDQDYCLDLIYLCNKTTFIKV